MFIELMMKYYHFYLSCPTTNVLFFQSVFSCFWNIPLKSTLALSYSNGGELHLGIHRLDGLILRHARLPLQFFLAFPIIHPLPSFLSSLADARSVPCASTTVVLVISWDRWGPPLGAESDRPRMPAFPAWPISVPSARQRDRRPRRPRICWSHCTRVCW